MSIRAHTWAYVRRSVVCLQILRAYVRMQEACTCKHTLNPNPKTEMQKKT